ncbi:MAG: ABC transporter permease subunit [Eubacteriales bacterium]|nr:ABC transporter permease subunit [Eubacteriales bacterium]
MNMLRSEFYKLKKSKAFWACVAACILFGAFLPLALQQAVLSGESEVRDLALSAVNILSFSFGMPFLSLIVGVFISIFVSSEFHYGTMKNALSKGMPRERVFLTKFAACAAAVTGMFILFIASILISGTCFFGFDPQGVFQLGSFLGMLLTTWLLFMAYTAVFEVVAMNMRSNGAAIATNICMVTVFPTILKALDFLLKSTGVKLSSLWLDGGVSAVTALPMGAGAVGSGLLMAVIYLAVMGAVGIALFRKTDVK